MPEIPDNIRRLLEEHGWGDTMPRLLKFAISRIRRLSWYGKRGGEVAISRMAQDFVMDAIAKVYAGERKWNPETCPDLLKYLIWVIHSDTNHAAQSSENKSTIERDDKDEFIKQEMEKFLEQMQQFIPLPGDYLLKEEQRQQDEEYLSGFIDFLDDDRPLVGIVECIMDGIEKPRDMATKLGVGVQEIYHMKKRLRRRLKEYQNNNRLQRAPLMEGSVENE